MMALWQYYISVLLTGQTSIKKIILVIIGSNCEHKCYLFSTAPCPLRYDNEYNNRDLAYDVGY